MPNAEDALCFSRLSYLTYDFMFIPRVYLAGYFQLQY